MTERPWEIADRDARIAALAARYAALQAQGMDAGAFGRALATVPRAPETPATVERSVSLPRGGYWFGRIGAGRLLRAANPQGAPGVAVMLWSAADPSERMNVHDSQKVQWTTRLGRGRMLLSDMGRPLALIADDTCGRHDALCGLGRNCHVNCAG